MIFAAAKSWIGMQYFQIFKSIGLETIICLGGLHFVAKKAARHGDRPAAR
jgi:hypothetical protein